LPKRANNASGKKCRSQSRKTVKRLKACVIIGAE